MEVEHCKKTYVYLIEFYPYDIQYICCIVYLHTLICHFKTLWIGQHTAPVFCVQ